MKKLLIGCGVVGLVIILLLVGGAFLSFHWLRSQVPHMEDVKQTRATLLERFGPRDEFVPDAAGSLSPERVARFVAVRESLLATRAEIGARLEGFIGRAEGQKVEGRGVFQKIIDGLNLARGGVGLFGEATEYVGVRAQRLLAAEMGEGEYTYLFCLMAYSWLQWDPLQVIDAEWFRSHDMEDALDEFSHQHQRVFVKQLRNLRRELEVMAARSPEQEKTLDLVRRALDETPADAFPFQGSMPPAWVAVLEPYRQRFEATLPRSPGDYILESVEQLIDEDENRGIRINMN